MYMENLNVCQFQHLQCHHYWFPSLRIFFLEKAQEGKIEISMKVECMGRQGRTCPV
jgi:hypothetical protein